MIRLFLLLLLFLPSPSLAQVAAHFGGANGGQVIVGYDSTPCDSSRVGAIRYSSMAGGAPTSGLVAYWPMDEAGGTAASDVAGGANATLQGTSSFSPTAGIIGGAAGGPGNNGDRIEVGDYHDFPGTANFTVSVWIYLRSHKEQYSTIIGNASLFGGTRSGWSLSLARPDASSPYEYLCTRWVADSQFNSGKYTPTMPYNVWLHYACVYNGTHIRTFKNGQFLHQTPDARSIPAAGAYLSMNGNASNSDLPNIQKNDALLDEVRIYNRALSSAEVAILYNCGIIGNCPAPHGPGIEYCNGTMWKTWGS